GRSHNHPRALLCAEARVLGPESSCAPITPTPNLSLLVEGTDDTCRLCDLLYRARQVLDHRGRMISAPKRHRRSKPSGLVASPRFNATLRDGDSVVQFSSFIVNQQRLFRTQLSVPCLAPHFPTLF